jgi:hypothetical protein
MAALHDIRRALERPELENNHGLVDRFIELLTGGKGFSTDEAEFRAWMADRTMNRGHDGVMLMNTQGEFKKRLHAQMAKWSQQNYVHVRVGTQNGIKALHVGICVR